MFFTNGLIQLFLFSFLINDSAYCLAFSLASSAILIPYAFTGFYQLKYSLAEDDHSRQKNILLGALTSLYGLWLIYAGGMDYFLLTMLLYGPGIILFAWVQKENRQRLFTKGEAVSAFGIILLFIFCIYQMIIGKLDVTIL